MITKPSTDEKVKAILDARQPVFEYLQTIGKTDAFNDFSKDEMCGLIRAAQQGVQDSLKRQCANNFNGNPYEDEIPF